MRKVFKAIAFVFIGMFLYGVVTFTFMIMKYGLHFGYVSDTDIHLISGLLAIAFIIGAMLSGNSSGKSDVSERDYTNDESDIGKIGEDISRGMIGDMSSSYYMLFDNDD